MEAFMSLVREKQDIPVPEEATLLEHAEALDKLAERLLMAEQRVFAQEVAQHGLTIPQFATLAAVETFPEGRERMGRVAELAHQCSATMTGIVDRLEAMGLLRREDNPEDRRSVIVVLTDAGRQKLAAVREQRRRRLARILSLIDPQVRVQVYQVLLQYTQALEQLASEQA
jgi:DNA-binding MarR family transcriptional regulator